MIKINNVYKLSNQVGFPAKQSMQMLALLLQIVNNASIADYYRIEIKKFSIYKIHPAKDKLLKSNLKRYLF